MAHEGITDQELTSVAANAQDVLVSADTFFPFDLFPDTIIIDRVKVTITRRTFFSVAEVISIQIEDVLNVEADVGPFFGSVKMWTRFFADKPMRISKLLREDALKIKRIMQGYIIARHKNIDCSNIDKENLVPMLDKLGHEAGRGTIAG